MTHLMFLASDDMRGRASGSAEMKRAQDYVVKRLIKYGFKGANSADRANPFFQSFEIFKVPTAGAPQPASDGRKRFGNELFEPGFFFQEGMNEASIATLRKFMRDPEKVQVTSIGDLQRVALLAGTLRNVVGRCLGSSRPNEYVVAMAHLDHLGAEGSTIFNGADDNASGSSVLLASLPALGELCRSKALERSLLLVWTDAEEKGLIGAWALVNPSLPGIPQSAMKGIVNMDMVGRWGNERLSVIDTAQGEHPNYFHDLLEKANAEAPRLFSHLDRDINRYRSYQDGSVFCVNPELFCTPTLFLYEGPNHMAGHEGEKIPEYHEPEDDIDLIIRDNQGTKLRRVTQLLVRVLEAAANRSER